jgi:hypothetical protein
VVIILRLGQIFLRRTPALFSALSDASVAFEENIFPNQELTLSLPLTGTLTLNGVASWVQRTVREEVAT